MSHAAALPSSSPSSPIRRPAALAATAVVGAAGLTLAAGPAVAESPSDVSSQAVQDMAGVLDSSAQSDLQTALAQLQDRSGLNLHVVYVHTFDGASANSWASEASGHAGLGQADAMLAIAVDDRDYSIAAPNNGGIITPSQLEQAVQDYAIPQLSSNNWGEAGVQLAQGLTSQWTTSSQQVDTAPAPTSSGATMGDAVGGLAGGVLAVGAVAAVGGWALSRRKKKQIGAGQQRPQVGGRREPEVPLDQLHKQAAAQLIAADDAIRSSEAELEFAKAQFGLQATDQFTQALEEAKQHERAAFQIRQELDDEIPETEPQQREMLGRLLGHTSRVDEVLSAQAAEFEKLRDIEANVPAHLADVEQRVKEVRADIEPARSELSRLATRYRGTSLTSIQENPDHASALLSSALEAVAEGRAKVDAGQRSQAARFARIGQEAVHQAATLLAAVDHAGDELAQAMPNLDKAIASISSDVQDANRLAPNDPVVTAARKEAEAAIAQGTDARGGHGDPLAALSRLASAEARIDATLEKARGIDESNRRAFTQASDTLRRVSSQIKGVSDYISTHRGAVGTEARTRLSEAIRLADDANAALNSDPQRALQLAGQAEQRTTQAQKLAENDVNNRSGGLGEWDVWGPGGGVRRRGGYYGGNRGGVDLGSLVLGGILFGGGGGGGGGGSWGGGSSGGFGGFGGGGGSFGGGFGGFGGGGGSFGGGGGSF